MISSAFPRESEKAAAADAAENAVNNERGEKDPEVVETLEDSRIIEKLQKEREQKRLLYAILILLFRF